MPTISAPRNPLGDIKACCACVVRKGWALSTKMIASSSCRDPGDGFRFPSLGTHAVQYCVVRFIFAIKS